MKTKVQRFFKRAEAFVALLILSIPESHHGLVWRLPVFDPGGSSHQSILCLMKRTCRGNDFKGSSEKKMKISFKVEIYWHVSSMRTLNNQFV